MNNNKPILAIIVPCYNEQDVVTITYRKLKETLDNLKREKISTNSYICFVNDGSSDKTLEIISEFAKNQDVKVISLSKNFGHQAAQLAGLVNNKADIFITIDADLQDDIAAIEKMVDEYHNGAEIVYGVRSDRSSDNFLKRITAEIFYKTSTILGVPTIYNHADFRLMSEKAVEALKKISENNIYLRGLIPTLGFKSAKVYYSRGKRIAGTPKYNIFSSIALAKEGITSFSVIPLRIISYLGLFAFFIAVFMTLYAFYRHLTGHSIQGWTSIMVSIYFLGGIQLISLGVLGEYIGKIYHETKHRPIYIIDKKFD